MGQPRRWVQLHNHKLTEQVLSLGITLCKVG